MLSSGRSLADLFARRAFTIGTREYLWLDVVLAAMLRGDWAPFEAALREGYARGDLKFELKGKRLRGSWVLVRIKRGDPAKPQWLLIKHRDKYAREGSDIVAEEDTSVATGRTMAGIAAGRSRVLR